MARKDPMIEAAEDELIDCMQMLWRLPDRERGWMGSQTAWPDVVRDWWEARPDPDAPVPRTGLGRREMARVERMFLDQGCIVSNIAPKDRKLVATVVTRKAGRMPGGFRWDDIWTTLRGRLPNASGESVKVSSDRMRARYEDALRRVALALAPLGGM